MPKVTVQSIADELGLSKFAVSRALSGKSGVSEETRRKVVAAAERQGYQARKLRRPDNSVVALIVCDPATANRELWIDVRHGIEMQSAREEFEIELHYSRKPDEVVDLAERSRGVIFVGPTDRAVLEAAQATGRPVVACCHIVPPLLEIDQVMATDEESGAAVGEYLLSLGHKDIVYLEGKAGFPGRLSRLVGLRAAAGDEARVSLMTFSEDYAGGEFAPAMRKLVQGRARPTAFFCGSDGVAVTCLSEVLRLGLRVPEDITVIGHADYPLATQVSPNLTTIRMPHVDVGVQAMRLLKARDMPDPNQVLPQQMRLFLLASLVERASSGPAGSPDWEGVLQTVRATGPAA